MLIKKSDDRSEELAQLERLAKFSTGDAAKYAAKDLAIRKAGFKGEAESAYLIDFDFADSVNWAVIHDLRLEYKGRTAQIDHLLINRWMECYVLETKHFRDGVKITEDGEFMRWNRFKHTFEGMPSPLEQNDRHIAVLRDAMKAIDLPTRLGMRIQLSFQSLILVSPTARIDRPKKFDASRVIKADQLRARISRDIDNENAFIGIVMTAAKIVSADTVRDVAKQLAKLHRPVKSTEPMSVLAASASISSVTPIRSAKIAEPPVTTYRTVVSATPVTLSSSTGSRCKDCQGVDGSIQYGKYGYYFQCTKCSANTAIKFTCQAGHKPRLRKAGTKFYRECAECSTSEIYFINL
ncbi:MAG: nuclease-related domain-containing protein [Rhodanobacter sp.]